jgi:hypothetical protein
MQTDRSDGLRAGVCDRGGEGVEAEMIVQSLYSLQFCRPKKKDVIRESHQHYRENVKHLTIALVSSVVLGSALILIGCKSSRPLSLKFMDRVSRNQYSFDTVRLNLQVANLKDSQLSRIFTNYLEELQKVRDYDARLLRRTLVRFDSKGDSLIMALYNESPVSVQYWELPSVSDSNSWYVVNYLNFHIIIRENEVGNRVVEKLFTKTNRKSLIVYGYNIKDGDVNIVDNLFWKYEESYMVNGDTCTFLKKEYVPGFIPFFR